MWAPRWVDKRVLARNADYALMEVASIMLTQERRSSISARHINAPYPAPVLRPSTILRCSRLTATF
jgi:hypothetical protein